MMKSNTQQFVGAVAALVIALLTPSIAAQEAAVSRGASGYGGVTYSKQWSQRLNGIDFEAHPLVEIVDYLRSEFDGVNFILDEELADETLTLRLRRVTLEDILQAISLATRGLVQCDVVSESLVHVRTEPAPHEESSLEAFSLKSYFADYEGDDSDALKELYRVLEQGLAMVRTANGKRYQGKMPQLNIHHKTKLLIVAGTKSDLSVVSSIIGALEKHAESARPGNYGFGQMGGGGGYGGMYGGGGGGGAGMGFGGGMPGAAGGGGMNGGTGGYGGGGNSGFGGGGGGLGAGYGQVGGGFGSEAAGAGAPSDKKE